MTVRIGYPYRVPFPFLDKLNLNQVRSDGGDIRAFKDAARTQPLSYWFDSAHLSPPPQSLDVWVNDDIASAVHLPDALHYWKLGDGVDEIDGDTITFTGGPSFGAGQVGDAVTLDGSTQYGTFPDATVADMDGKAGFSFSTWFKRVTTGAVEAILDWSTTAGNSKVFLVIDATGSVDFRVRAADAEAEQSVVTTGAWTDTLWHHLVVTVDLATDTMTVYVDGVAEATTGSPSFTAGTFSGGAEVGTGRLGVNGAATLFHWEGSFDEHAHYGRALTADEAKSLHVRGLENRELIAPPWTAYWSFDNLDNTGSELLDIYGGNNGTKEGAGAATFVAGRVEGTALAFDGVDDRVRILDADDLSPQSGGAGAEMGIGVTLRVPALPSKNEGIVVKDGGISPRREYSLAYNADGSLDFRILDNTAGSINNSTRTVVSAETMGAYVGRDFHIFARFEHDLGAALRCTIYLDGVEVEQTRSEASYTSSSNSISDVFIGDSPATGTYDFTGNIDEVYILGNAPTPAQIDDLARTSERGLRADSSSVWSSMDVRLHMPFGTEYQGEVVEDQSGNGYHLTESGDMKLGLDAQVGQGFSRANFGGVGSRYQQSNAALRPSLDPFTVAGWIKLAPTATSQYFWDLNSANPRINFSNDLGGANGSLNQRLLMNATTAGGSHNFTYNLRAEDEGEWLFVCYTNQGGGNGAFYVGRAVDSTWATPVTSGGATGTFNAGTWNFGSDNAGNNILQLATTMTEQGIMVGRALTEAEARELWQKGMTEARYTASPLFAVLAHNDPAALTTKSATNVFGREPIPDVKQMLHFDDEVGEDNTVTDEAAFANGEVIGEASVQEGAYGKMLDLGAKSCVEFPSSVHVENTTITIWGDIETTDDSCIVRSCSTGDSTKAGWAIEIDGLGRLRLRYENTFESLLATVTSPVVNDGARHRYVAVIEDGIGVSLYVDAIGNVATASLAGSDTIVTPESNDYIGQYGFPLALPPTNLKGDWDFDRDTRTLVGDKISAVVDQAASMGDLSQATDANRPVFSPRGLNGRGAGLFNRTSGAWMEMATGIDQPTHDFIFMAALQLQEDIAADDADPDLALITGKLVDSAGDHGEVAFGSVYGGTNDVMAVSGNASAGIHRSGHEGTALSTATPFLYEVRVVGEGTSATPRWFVNGAELAQTFTAGSGAITPGAASGLGIIDLIGGRDNGTRQLRGLIGRVAIWTAATNTGPGTNGAPLTDADITAARRTMMLQFGIEAASTYNANVMKVRGDLTIDEQYVTVSNAFPAAADITEFMTKGYAFLAENTKMIVRDRVDVEPSMRQKL